MRVGGYIKSRVAAINRAINFSGLLSRVGKSYGVWECSEVSREKDEEKVKQTIYWTINETTSTVYDHIPPIREIF